MPPIPHGMTVGADHVSMRGSKIWLAIEDVEFSVAFPTTSALPPGRKAPTARPPTVPGVVNTHTPVPGSYSSADVSWALTVEPPAASTLPVVRGIAAWLCLGLFIVPV